MNSTNEKAGGEKILPTRFGVNDPNFASKQQPRREQVGARAQCRNHFNAAHLGKDGVAAYASDLS